MGGIDYARFSRVLLRCAEVASEQGIKLSVVRVYQDTLKSAAEAFLAADVAVRKAETAFKREQREAIEALDSLDRPYREVRSMVLAFAPESVLPETLRVQPTDTDKVDAIEKMLDAIDDHAGEAWADELSEGTFGQLAAATVQEIGEAIAANKGLASSREARAAAYGPAYERYLRFKRVVREALGAKSRQYQRIHLRSPNARDDAPDTLPEPPETKPKGSLDATPPTERIVRAMQPPASRRGGPPSERGAPTQA